MAERRTGSGVRRGRAGWLALLMVFAVVATSCNYDWTGFGNDAGHSNATSDTGISTANVATLAPAFSIPNIGYLYPQPVVSHGVLYIAKSYGVLAAYDATGVEGCSGTPKTCVPLWTGDGPGPATVTPAVTHGFVVVGGRNGVIAAYDAAGITGCSGTPKTCVPVWTATYGTWEASIQVAGDRIYVIGGPGPVLAYDAAGVIGCSGTPRTCQPIWTGPADELTSGVVAPVSGGKLYVVDRGTAPGGPTLPQISVFDVDTAGCSADTPMVCTPESIVPLPLAPYVSPAVVGGVLYVPTSDGALLAYDAATIATCSASPADCQPLWRAPTQGWLNISSFAGGRVFLTGSGDVRAFDAAGVVGCDGTPKVCTPLWRGSDQTAYDSYSVVANGVVYVTKDPGVAAYDAAGKLGCSGTPTVCTPLWSAPGGYRRPIVAQGTLWVPTDGSLVAYRPTPPPPPSTPSTEGP